MKRNSLRHIILLTIISPLASVAISQNIVWQKALGGTGTESGVTIAAHADGGFVAIGHTESINDGDVSGIHLPSPPLLPVDAWVVKLSAAGSIEWQKCLGGTNFDEGTAISTYPDGNSILTAYTASNDGDITGYHGGGDAWLVKLNASGSILWQKCIGGTSYDRLSSVSATTDGGAVMAGSSNSTDGDVSGNHGGNDVWVVKLDSSGNIEWQKSLGGTGEDYGRGAHPAPDGGYIVTGISDSANGDVTVNQGGQDLWVIKLSANGSLEWQKSLGGTGTDEGTSVVPVAAGGYLVLGNTGSNDGDVSGNHGISDAWVVKLDSAGNVEWQQCYGGTQGDRAYCIQNTSDGGFTFAGHEYLDGIGNHGLNDVWVVKATATGASQAQVFLGGTDEDLGASIVRLSDGSSVITGSTASNDGDVSGLHGIASDMWVVKIDSNWVGTVPAQVLSKVHLFPNPATDGGLHLQFSLTAASNVEIEISDVAGQMLGKHPSTLLPAGIHETIVNVQPLPAGIYFLRLITETGVQTLRWVKADSCD